MENNELETRINRVIAMVADLKNIECGDDIYYDFEALTRECGNKVEFDAYFTVGDAFSFASDAKTFAKFFKGYKRLMRMYREFYRPVAA